MNVLLIQARRANDPMLLHEQRCVARRAEPLDIAWSPHNVVETPVGPEVLAGVDAVVIGGSGDYSVYHPLSRRWVDPLARLVDAALEQGVPGFGICFGHQLLGQVLGATVITDSERTEIGTVDLELTTAGQSDPLFGQLPSTFRAQTGHSDRVVSTPERAELMVSGAVVDTQAFRVKGCEFFSAQFHPDLTGGQARERYMAYRDKLEGHAAAHAETQANRFSTEQDAGSKMLGLFASYLQNR